MKRMQSPASDDDFSDPYNSIDLLRFIDKNKKKIKKEMNEKQLIRYLSSIILLRFFLTKIGEKLEVAKQAYLEEIVKGKGVSQMEDYAVIFEHEPDCIEMQFVLHPREVYAIDKAVKKQKEIISRLEKRVKGTAADTISNRGYSYLPTWPS